MRVDLPVVRTRHTLFSRSEESSEEQLKSLCQNLEDLSLVPCGSDNKEFVILTPEIKFDSLNTCDSQSAYYVFNLPAFEALSVHQNFPDRQSTLLFVRDEGVEDQNNPYDAVQSGDKLAGCLYHQNRDLLLGDCGSDYSYHVDAESYYYSVKGQQIGDKEAPSHDQYNCHHCGKTFFSTLSFRHHLKVEHAELNELRCIFCE